MFLCFFVLNMLMQFTRCRNCLAFKLSATPTLWQRRPSYHSIDFLKSKINNNDSDIESLMNSIEDEIFHLNGGKTFNLNSPRQISDVIYGFPNDKNNKNNRSTSKRALMNLINGEGVWNSTYVSQEKREIAQKILRWKSYSTQRRRQFSTATHNANDKNTDDIKQLDQRDIPKSTSKETKSSYEIFVDSLFDSSGNKINDYWKEILLSIDKPKVRDIVGQLTNSCPMGYNPIATPNSPSGISENGEISVTQAGKKGSLLSYVREQRERLPECILLTRVGEFYEAFGIDAIALMQFCGLNPMGGKARAGCPAKNIQSTLDDLVYNGFKVAVYEEASDTDSETGPGRKSRLKNRMLAQIISAASPTYLHGLVLDDGWAIGSSSSSSIYRNNVGIISTPDQGYTLVEVSMEERTVCVRERLTPEAIATILADPPADPLLYIPYPGEKNSVDSLPFLPSRKDVSMNGPGSRIRVKKLDSFLLQENTPGLSDIERASKAIISAVVDQSISGSCVTSISYEDFVHVGSGASTKPLHLDTATQLGIMDDKTIPSLVRELLPESAPAASSRFLKRYLLVPPPTDISEAMACLVSELKSKNISLPPLAIPPIGKVLSMIRAGQASASVYSEIVVSLDALINVINCHRTSDIITPLQQMVEYETGMSADIHNLLKQCQETRAMITEVVNTGNIFNGETVDQITEAKGIIPRNFVERNEAVWRGRVRPEALGSIHIDVSDCAETLIQAVLEDFWGISKNEHALLENEGKTKSPIVQDLFDNLISIRSIPSWVSEEDKHLYYHPRDRNRKPLSKRFTTEKVETSLYKYLEACENACKGVTKILQELSESICQTGKLPSIVQSAHANLILSTVYNHASQANTLNWEMASIVSSNEDNDWAGSFSNLFPYWMKKSEAVSNSFDLNGMFLLTAPNMSGKSTLMRSIASAFLLSSVGLCAPLSASTKLRRFDAIFVRGASADIPVEGKSAFGAEMGDIASMMRLCGSKSLVFVDELGRGTSPRDGTSIAGAVLEEMAKRGMCGVFATHLHGILSLPLSFTADERIRKMRMEICPVNEHSGTGGDTCKNIQWTYRLQEGVCTESLALLTAAKFGLPIKIIDRAKELSNYIPETSSNGNHETMGNHKEEASDNHYSRPTFDQAIKLLGSILGDNYQIEIIQPKWHSPPSFEGQSCVYIIEVNDDFTSKFYVGETDRLNSRLNRHRSRFQTQNLIVMKTAVVCVNDKTQARKIEGMLIRKMANTGFSMLSYVDGRSQ